MYPSNPLPQSRLGEIATLSGRIRKRIRQGERGFVATFVRPFLSPSRERVAAKRPGEGAFVKVEEVS
jgi:hypothetical protein